MNNPFSLERSIFLAAVLALPVAHAAPMGQAEYDSGKARIGTDYKADKAACDSMASNAKDICVEEASGKEKVARAELEAGHSGKPADRNKVLVAKAESAYAVAKEKCDDQSGNGKDVCVAAAKAIEVRGLADAKMGKKIGEAKTDAAQTKLDADYKLAAEKCDSLASDAKTACMTAAKSRFGKT